MTFAAAAERKELYRFSVDLGKLALRIAELHGTNADRWYVPLAWLSLIPNVFFSRSLVMYCSMVSAYENVHIRSNLPRLEDATKYANSAGDRCAIRLQNVIFVKLDIVGCIQASRISIPSKPNCSLANRVCRYLHFGHNPAFLMNDPVDELVGAAEEVVMSSIQFFFLL